jgi:ABC-2 type transport system permease protein
MIFMAIISYGVWVAMSVAEEKGSRVMELMLNATTPLQMLTGKVVGNGAAGLTQYGAVIAAAAIGTIAQDPIRRVVLGSSSGSSLEGLTPAVLGAFIVLFLLGFLFYALLYAALGSLVSRQEDVQSATSPLMMIIMVGYFAAAMGQDILGSQGMAIMSQIPLFSPYVMLRRVAEGTVAPWEFGLAVVLLLAAIGIALLVAARIYSAGVLLYGQRVGLREVLRAARVTR